jgi:hypothetical protein
MTPAHDEEKTVTEEKNMHIIFRCGGCQAVLKAPGCGAGGQGTCPRCGHAVRVPGPAAQAPATPDAPPESVRPVGQARQVGGPPPLALGMRGLVRPPGVISPPAGLIALALIAYVVVQVLAWVVSLCGAVPVAACLVAALFLVACAWRRR